MKNFYIVSAAIIVVGLAVLVADHIYQAPAPYDRCISDCVVVGLTKEDAAAACARLHNSN